LGGGRTGIQQFIRPVEMIPPKGNKKKKKKRRSIPWKNWIWGGGTTPNCRKGENKGGGGSMKYDQRGNVGRESTLRRMGRGAVKEGEVYKKKKRN